MTHCKILQNSRRGSGDSGQRTSRRDSQAYPNTITPRNATKKKRDSLAATDIPNFRQEQRPSTSSTASDSVSQNYQSTLVDTGCQALPTPIMVVSSVTPPATSPTYPKGRRDSTTQCGRKNRRDSRVGGVSPDRAPRLSRLQRQVRIL